MTLRAALTTAAAIAAAVVVYLLPMPGELDPVPTAAPVSSATPNPASGGVAPEHNEVHSRLKPAATAQPIPSGRRAPRRLDTAPSFNADAGVTPGAAATHYALHATNWSADTLPRQRRRLQRLASGPLEHELRRDAGYRRTLATVRHDQAAQIGRLVSIAVDRDGDRATARVLLSEQLYGTSLGNLPARSQGEYGARLRHTSRGWTVADWRLEP